jgi:two-component system chemotaxis response regulator CheB
MQKIRVLIVDDSVVVRRILSDALSTDPELDISTAANGRIALAKITQVNPDILTMDVEMPELDGIATLKELRKTHANLPVIMFSTLTERGAVATLDALAAGANDYVTKPANVGSVAIAISRVKDELIPKIKALCGRHTPVFVPVAPSRAEPLPPRPVAAAPQTAGPIEIVTIGVSTGGPNALSAMMPQLPADIGVPIVIVQHMPPIFTKLLATRLDEQCQIDVAEGASGMPLRPGQAIIAAGGLHMVVERQAGRVCVATNMNPPENSCRPAVDVLFRSVAAAYGPRVLAVVLTGMGNDGLRGCELVRDVGGQVIVQDEKTSVVWGMPGCVAAAQLAHKILPLPEIAGEITCRVAASRGRTPVAKAS